VITACAPAPALPLTRSALPPPPRPPPNSTLIVARSARGAAALAPRNTGSPRKGVPDLGLRDFSGYYAKVTPVYDRAYINELAYMEAGKEKSKERRAIEEDREKRLRAKQKAAYLAGGRGGAPPPPAGGESSTGGGGFFDRLEAMEKRLQDGRSDAKLAFEYEHQPDKLYCPSCGGQQSWAEVKAKQKRCTKDKCGGAGYRPKLLWSEVQGSFLGRWEAGIKKAAVNKAKLEAEVLPPFRVTHRHVFDKESGGMVEQPIPVPVWEAVRGEFYARNDEAIARIEARVDLAAKEAAKLADRIKPPTAKEYKFSKPLPPFWDRQKAMLESARYQDYDTRASMLGGS